MATVRPIAITTGAVGLLIMACQNESHAGPPSFPDLTGFAPVNVSDYTITLPNPGRAPQLSEVVFLTPDGISCRFITPPAARCTGNNFPAVPPAASNPAAGMNFVNAIGTDSDLSQTNDPIASGNTVQDHPIRTLPPFHSITVDGVICGVDNAGTTACKDAQGRGFVLSPRGSGWLPHV
jgi:hypothetical protein